MRILCADGPMKGYGDEVADEAVEVRLVETMPLRSDRTMEDDDPLLPLPAKHHVYKVDESTRERLVVTLKFDRTLEPR